jgi:hypothetical protein
VASRPVHRAICVPVRKPDLRVSTDLLSGTCRRGERDSRASKAHQRGARPRKASQHSGRAIQSWLRWAATGQDALIRQQSRQGAAAAHQQAEAVSHAPDVPPYSQHQPSLALASLRLRSRIEDGTALTIDHHLALDTLVMRRSLPRHRGAEACKHYYGRCHDDAELLDFPPLFYQPEDVILLADRDASHAPVLHTNERLEEALGRWMSRITVMPKLARNRLPVSGLTNGPMIELSRRPACSFGHHGSRPGSTT